MLGVAYKTDMDDWRESPALKLIELLQNAGAAVDYHDPHVPVLRFRRDRPRLDRCRSTRAHYDVVVIATAHSAIDYADRRGRRSWWSTCATRPAAPITSEKVWKRRA